MTSAPRSPAAQSLGESLDLLRLLWAVDHAMHRTSKRMEARLGVTGPQRLLLRIVGRFPGITAGEVARFIDAHASTVTGLVKRLRRRGLIRVEPDPADRRRVRLALSVAGRDVDVQASGTIEAAIAATLVALGSRRVALAAGVLRELRRQLENDLPESEGDRLREPSFGRRRLGLPPPDGSGRLR